MQTKVCLEPNPASLSTLLFSMAYAQLMSVDHHAPGQNLTASNNWKHMQTTFDYLWCWE